jgi:hypothetical protein
MIWVKIRIRTKMLKVRNTAFYQCCGSGMFISDPIYSIPNPESMVDKILDPDPRQYFLYFYPKKLLRNKIQGVHPGSRGQKSTGSQICNSVFLH